MAILGIADDIFDIRWRHKVFLPAIASIPLLIVYYVDFNVTVVTTPKPLLPYLPRLIELGYSFDVTNDRLVVLWIHGVPEYLLH
jgi:UDP-N-acetylglucosamine--dolichyl-phosphate N-acetylglucosaminephosphotransferase